MRKLVLWSCCAVSKTLENVSERKLLRKLWIISQEIKRNFEHSSYVELNQKMQDWPSKTGYATIKHIVLLQCRWNFHLIASPKDVGPGYVAEVTANAMVWTQKYLLGQGFDLNLPEFAKKLPMFLNVWTTSYTCRFEDSNLSSKEEILRNLRAFGAQKMGSMDRWDFRQVFCRTGGLSLKKIRVVPLCWAARNMWATRRSVWADFWWFLTGEWYGMIMFDHSCGTPVHPTMTLPSGDGFHSYHRFLGIRRGIYCGYLWMVALGFPHYHCHQAQINQQSTQPWQRRLWGLDSGDPTLLQPPCHLAEKICGHLWPMVRSRRREGRRVACVDLPRFTSTLAWFWVDKPLGEGP